MLRIWHLWTDWSFFALMLLFSLCLKEPSKVVPYFIALLKATRVGHNRANVCMLRSTFRYQCNSPWQWLQTSTDVHLVVPLVAGNAMQCDRCAKNYSFTVYSNIRAQALFTKWINKSSGVLQQFGVLWKRRSYEHLLFAQKLRRRPLNISYRSLPRSSQAVVHNLKPTLANQGPVTLLSQGEKTV